MNTYHLMSIHIDCSTGAPIALLNVRVTDGETGAVSGIDRTVPSSPAATTKMNAIIADVIGYLQTKYPTITVTLPPLLPPQV